MSLSLVCAVKGYPLHIVTSDAFAREKLEHMKILGARLQIVPSESGRMTEKLTRDMIEAARIIAAETGGFWTDQMNNRDQIAAYHEMADEIWTQTDGQIDAFVQSVGTAASLRGIGEALAPPQRTDQDRRRGARRIAGPVGRPAGRAQDRRDRRGLRRTALAGRTSPIRSSGFPRKRPWPWPFGWPARKAFLPGLPPAPMSSPPCDWPNNWDLARPSSRVMCDTGMKYLSK